MYVLAGLLVIGFVCNLAVRPVDARYHMAADDLPDRPGTTRRTAQSA
jgi:hypothetical protein